MLKKITTIRMMSWWLIAAIMSAVIAWVAPQQLGVTVYKLSLVALAALVGYYVDRSVFPYARPDDLSVERGLETAAAWLRRAIIIAAAMIAVSLGA